MKTKPFAVLAAAMAVFAAPVASAGCGNRPGTPTDVAAGIPSSDRDFVHVSWTNTASETVWWDIEMRDGQGREPTGAPRAGFGRGDDGIGQRFTYTFSIGPAETRCFRVKARTEPGTQGCVSEQWSNQACVTAPDCRYGADTCTQGYVWREAWADDHVCVIPAVRQQARDDNAQAAARRSPNGGPYGPDTCRQGYVWREASPNDHVCVAPATRRQAAQDNAQKATRDACPY